MREAERQKEEALSFAKNQKDAKEIFKRNIESFEQSYVAEMEQRVKSGLQAASNKS